LSIGYNSYTELLEECPDLKFYYNLLHVKLVIQENLSSLIDVYTHAGSTFYNHVTLTFDPLTLVSVHAKQLPRTVCLLILVLLAPAMFLSDHRCPDTQLVIDATDHPMHGPAAAVVANGFKFSLVN